MNFEKENIEGELIKNNQGGFSVPESYFEKLESDIFAKTANVGFTVPNGYFDTLESKITDKISKPKLSISYSSTYAKVLSGIAAALIVISGFIFMNRNLMPNKQNKAFSKAVMDEVSDEEIITYVDESDIRESHIIDVAFTTKDKSQNQVEDYLINNAEEQLIIEEL